MSMMGELFFFLIFQVKQIRKNTCFNQLKLFKKFDRKGCKEFVTPMSISGHLDNDEKEKSFYFTKYRRQI